MVVCKWRSRFQGRFHCAAMRGHARRFYFRQASLEHPGFRQASTGTVAEASSDLEEGDIKKLLAQPKP